MNSAFLQNEAGVIFRGTNMAIGLGIEHPDLIVSTKLRLLLTCVSSWNAHTGTASVYLLFIIYKSQI